MAVATLSKKATSRPFSNLSTLASGQKMRPTIDSFLLPFTTALSTLIISRTTNLCRIENASRAKTFVYQIRMSKNLAMHGLTAF